DRWRCRRRGWVELPVEALEGALRPDEALDVGRVPQHDLRELLAAAALQALDRLDLLRGAKSGEGAGRRRDLFVRVDLPEDGGGAIEIRQRLRQRHAPEDACRAPFAHLERPAQARRGLEVELGPPVQHDLADAQVLAEVDLFAATGREDVDVLLD